MDASVQESEEKEKEKGREGRKKKEKEREKERKKGKRKRRKEKGRGRRKKRRGINCFRRGDADFFFLFFIIRRVNPFQGKSPFRAEKPL